MSTKRTFLLLFFVALSYTTCSQNNFDFLSNFSIEYGVNWVDSSGNQDPLTIFKDYSNIAFKLPFTLEVDYFLSDTFELYLSGSSNKFLENQKVDVLNSNRTYNYFSIDFGVNHAVLGVDVFSTNIIGFVKAGIGIFKVESLGFSANIGVGGIIYLTENMDFVIFSVGKFAVEQEYLNSNHFQHFIGLKYSFSYKRANCFCPRSLNY